MMVRRDKSCSRGRANNFSNLRTFVNVSIHINQELSGPKSHINLQFLVLHEYPLSGSPQDTQVATWASEAADLREKGLVHLRKLRRRLGA